MPLWTLINEEGRGGAGVGGIWWNLENLFSHANFPEMNVKTIVYGGTESSNHKEGGQLSLKIVFKNKNSK